MLGYFLQRANDSGTVTFQRIPVGPVSCSKNVLPLAPITYKAACFILTPGNYDNFKSTNIYNRCDQFCCVKLLGDNFNK